MSDLEQVVKKNERSYLTMSELTSLSSVMIILSSITLKLSLLKRKLDSVSFQSCSFVNIRRSPLKTAEYFGGARTYDLHFCSVRFEGERETLPSR